MVSLTRHPLLLVVLLLASALPVRATRVVVELPTRETYVGVPTVLRLIVEDGEPDQAPIAPAVPGATIRLAGGPSRSVNVLSINGQTTQKVSVSYAYQVTPSEPGKLTIPPFDVQVAGRKYRTQPQVLIVSASDTGDLMFVEVTGRRPSAYVGEPLDVTLQIWLKPYQDRQFQFTFQESHMWGQINLEASQWGVFTEALQQMFSQRRRPVGRETIRKDKQGNERAYYLYEIPHRVWAERPGKLDVGNINVMVVYPTALGRGRSLFDAGSLAITETRSISAQVRIAPVEIKPIPAEGRPAWYRGAVGQFTMTASAKPTEMAVGDPITLTLTVTGSGRLDQLQPPPLPDLPELTRDFKVPTDPLAGEVQGNAKRFTQSIRATSDAVKQIPPIPFAYFDPRQERFVIVRSQPIAIAVRPAEKMSSAQVVDAAGGGGPAARVLTEVSGGILANYTEMEDVLAQQAVRPGAGLFALACLPPVVFGICRIVQYRRDRLRHDAAYARRRTARHLARSRIRHPGGAAGSSLPAAALNAIGGYVADRCNLPAGGLTRAEAVRHLTERGVRPTLVEQVDRLLAECEQMQFAGTGGSDPRELAREAARCIDLLDRERF